MFNFFKRSSTQATEQKAAPTSGVSSPEPWLTELFGSMPANSGINVTPETAMRCAAVRCAVLAISEAIGQLPVHVYARGDKGAKTRSPDHPVHRLVHDEASDWISASDLREQLTRDALLHGNGFAFINRIENRPVELNRLDPTAITIEVGPTTGEPVYRVNGPDRRLIARQNVLHIKAPSFNGISGESPVRQCREAIGLALVMEQHAAKLFGNGARPSGLITFTETMSPDALMNAKLAWQAAHGNGRNGGTAVFDKGAKWEALTLNSVDAQFLELRKFAIEEIARAFRVPPVLLMDYGRATWGNSEEMGRQFLTYTLMPWLKRWEGEIRLKLFEPGERDAFFAEFLTDDLQRADTAARMDSYSKAIAARILSPNEVRAMENRPPYEGGDRFENPNTMAGSSDD